MVLVDPSELVWTVLPNTIASVTPTGTTVTVTGVFTGNGNVVVTEKYSGVSASSPITVLPNLLTYNWTASTAVGRFQNPVLAPDGSVVVNIVDDSNSANCALNCYESSTGALRWSTKVGGPILASAVFDGAGHVFAGGTYGVGFPKSNPNVFALSLATGSVIWSTANWNASVNIPLGLTYGNGTLFVGLDGTVKNVFALNPANGTTIWSDSISGTAANTPAYSSVGNQLFVSSVGGTVNAYNATTGSLNWTKTYSGSTGILAHPSGDAIVSSLLNGFVKLNGTNGNQKWLIGNGYPFRIAVLAQGGYLFAGTDTQTVGVTPDGGPTLFYFQPAQHLTVEANNSVYVSNNNGLFVYLNNQTGLSWQFPASIGGHASTPGGTVYAAHLDKLYSIHP